MKNEDLKHDDPCTDDRCDCNRTFQRREFLAVTGLATAGALASGHALPVMAGPFESENEYLKIIPIDKKLDPDWVASLFARGDKDTYTDSVALQHIGMPVGGLFAGTVYLSGDGRLWLWDIFNADQEGIAPRPIEFQGKPIRTRSGGNYVEPVTPEVQLKKTFFGPATMAGKNYVNPVHPNASQLVEFFIRIGDERRALDSSGFRNVSFDGRYPIGHVVYHDDDCPIEVSLNAFSPFIPLCADDSSLPATVMEYTVKNRGSEPLELELSGCLWNAVCHETAPTVTGRLSNRVVREPGLTAIECSAEEITEQEAEQRPDILFEDFEKATYEQWTVEGDAFGTGPMRVKDIPDYQGDVAGQGKRVVNSHASAPGDSINERDSRTGVLTSQPFKIERKYIRFLIGGGAHQDTTCVNLLIDGKPVASRTGHSDNRMQPTALDVHQYEGKQARIQVVDQARGAWGNIGVDEIVFTDRPLKTGKLTEQRDFGTMALAILGKGDNTDANASGFDERARESATSPLGSDLLGQVSRKIKLAPGQSATVAFVVSWHFPNFYARGMGNRRVGHSYAARFHSATEVARYVAKNYNRLAGDTKKWVETWYDSTLPYWFLDRTMANASTLATTTCYRLADGRFWAWEGIGCCQGTCTHVWHYAQALGRLFPEIERGQREQVDFGIALHQDGGIGMRAGLTGANEPAHDGQCGRILGAYREHQMTADGAFLKRTWPRIKQAVEYLIRKDANADGMIEGAQPNTLDAAWFGKISFIASLYLATLRAGAEMATEMGDDAFAKMCREIAERGEKSILETYNGEYFIQIEEEAHKKDIGIGPGCYIDQVFGQTWAHWVGLGPLFDRDKQLSALRALWKYNFVPDVGPFRQQFPRGRWYAMAGDAGLLMCTWPKGGQNPDFKDHWQYMYFNECMSGFEWQAAAHMIAEGIDQPDLLQNGLAISRAIHDRYNARLRNPYNEIECSDHYARAMASFGAYQAACGFTCHGPKGQVGFAPRLTPEDFKCAFTAAEGWGSYYQHLDEEEGTLDVAIDVKWGKLRLRELNLALPHHEETPSIVATLGDKRVKAEFRQTGGRTVIEFATDLVVQEDQLLKVKIG